MDTKKILTTIFIRLLIVIAVLAVTYVQSEKYFSLKEKQERNSAIDACLSISNYTYTNAESGVTTIEPIESSLTKCLELKGIK